MWLWGWLFLSDHIRCPSRRAIGVKSVCTCACANTWAIYHLSCLPSSFILIGSAVAAAVDQSGAVRDYYYLRDEPTTEEICCFRSHLAIEVKKRPKFNMKHGWVLPLAYYHRYHLTIINTIKSKHTSTARFQDTIRSYCLDRSKVNRD